MALTTTGGPRRGGSDKINDTSLVSMNRNVSNRLSCRNVVQTLSSMDLVRLLPVNEFVTPMEHEHRISTPHVDRMSARSV